jgi:hypothetical protein
MPRKREEKCRNGNDSDIWIQKLNNGLVQDLRRIAGEHNMSLPMFLRFILMETKQKYKHFLDKPKLDY